MMSNMFVFITMGLVVLGLASARPQHFMDASSQVSGEDGSGHLINGLTNYQLELIAQRLSDYNNELPIGFDRNLLRSPEMKRASRFRQCYFNPVSCFKKEQPCKAEISELANEENGSGCISMWCSYVMRCSKKKYNSYLFKYCSLSCEFQ